MLNIQNVIQNTLITFFKMYLKKVNLIKVIKLIIITSFSIQTIHSSSSKNGADGVNIFSGGAVGVGK